MEIHELTDANEKILAYKGNSPIFTVHEGENNEEIELKKVDGQNQEQKQEFTVTFDAAGGAFDDGSETQQITVQEGTPATAPKTQPTYQGHIFDFWATRQDDVGLSQYEFSQPVTGNLTLYAQWRAQNQVASVKFNPATSTVDYNTEITLSCDIDGATIYYTTDKSDPTTSSTQYQDTPITITAETTIKAYAVKSGMTDSTVTEITYSLNQYTVQFVLNEGSFTESGKETSLSVQSGTEVVLKNYQVERAGYTFGGWYYDATFNTPVEDSGIVTPTQANITLYAKWEAVSSSEAAYYVKADGNDSDNDGLSPETPFKSLKYAITQATSKNINTIYIIGTLNAESESFSGSGTGAANSVFYISESNIGTEDKPLQLIGYPDPENTATLSADDSASARVFATSNNAHIKMQDLTISGGKTSGSGGAIYYCGGSLYLENCIIEENTTTAATNESGLSYDGIYIYGNGKLTMIDTECYDGIYLYQSPGYFGGDCYIGYDEPDIPVLHIEGATIEIGGPVTFMSPIYVADSAQISVNATLENHTIDDPNQKIELILQSYSRTDQVITAADGVTLADEVGKFTLANSGYKINSDGTISTTN